jgi:carbon monoxide dehydrogenase subunit G
VIIEGTFILRASAQKVWDALFKPGMLASCIPGAERIEAIDEKTYDCVVGAKVGVISVKFKFTTTLTEIAAPTHLKATGRGEELSKAGYFSQKTVVNLKENSPEETEVSYRTEVTVVGRLAAFGDRVMAAKAKEVETKFTEALSKKLLGEEVSVPKLKVGVRDILGSLLGSHSKGKE